MRVASGSSEPGFGQGAKPLLKLLREYGLIAGLTSVAMTVTAFHFPIWERPAPTILPTVLVGPDLSADPRPGASLPGPLTAQADALGRKVPRSLHRVLVVNGGTCTSCQRDAVKFERLPLREFDAVFVFFQSTEVEIRDQFKHAPAPNLYLFADPREATLQALNALWTGRWYEFRDGKLVRAQSNSPRDVSWSQT